jgi:hypothetical protein
VGDERRVANNLGRGPLYLLIRFRGFGGQILFLATSAKNKIWPHVQAAKKAGRTVDDVVKTWKVPERYIQAGYTQIGDDPRMGSSRLRTNVVEVIWNETK